VLLFTRLLGIILDPMVRMSFGVLEAVFRI
jgi:hypothetical protein